MSRSYCRCGYCITTSWVTPLPPHHPASQLSSLPNCSCKFHHSSLLCWGLAVNPVPGFPLIWSNSLLDWRETQLSCDSRRITGGRNDTNALTFVSFANRSAPVLSVGAAALILQLREPAGAAAHSQPPARETRARNDKRMSLKQHTCQQRNMENTLGVRLHIENTFTLISSLLPAPSPLNLFHPQSRNTAAFVLSRFSVSLLIWQNEDDMCKRAKWRKLQKTHEAFNRSSDESYSVALVAICCKSRKYSGQQGPNAVKLSMCWLYFCVELTAWL